jgi:hypothetical protein
VLPGSPSRRGRHDGPIHDGHGTRIWRDETASLNVCPRRLDEDARFLGWFERLLRDVDGIADPEISNQRLVRTQWALIDLIDFLDPARVRLGADYREKYQWTAPSPVPSTASLL